MKPVKVYKSAANVASIFLNEYGYTVNLHRRFQRQENQEWESTSVFRQADLPQVALLLKLATGYIAEQDGFTQKNSSMASADEETQSAKSPAESAA